MSSIKTILVATDFSAPSEKAVDEAVSLAKLLGAELHLFHAVEIPVPVVTPYEVAVPADLIAQTREAAAARLKTLEERLASSGLSVKAHLSESPAASGISHAAEELGADLVVMGTRGNTGLKHVLLGSVAERTMRHAPCSVLAVKHPDDD